MARRRRLILAYVILGAGGLAVVGGLFGSDAALQGGLGLAYLTALVHMVSFLVRGVPRGRPALLLGAGRAVLLGAVAAVLAVAGLDLVVAIGGWWTVDDSDGASASMVVTAAIATTLLAAALWRRPSARRASLLNLTALMLLAPTTVTLLEPSVTGVTDVILVVNLVVVVTVGISLDRLFASVDDAPAGPTVAPARLV